MTRFTIIAFAAFALVLSSCSNSANNIVLSSLNRSAKIQLLCADVELVAGNRYTLRSLLPAVLCTPEATFDPDINARFLGAVTQIQTGEVAVVDFTSSTIINTNQTIPGVTAVTVGEQPTGIQISPFDPTFTYVTSFSPKSLQAIESAELVSGEALQAPQEVRFDGGPTDLAMHESATTVVARNDDGQITGVDPTASKVEYRYLYAAIPDLGHVVQVQVMIDENGAQTLGEPFPLPLGDPENCDTVTQVTPPDSNATDYNRICPVGFLDRQGRVVKTVTTTQPCSEGPSVGPRPVSLAIDLGSEHGTGAVMESDDTFSSGDTDDDFLLVADANQPLIHRFKLSADGATRMDPIVTGTPTSEIDVTPLVPRSSDPDDTAATERYLYAVSAIDGSILVVDYTEDPPGTTEEDKKFGSVLPVLSGVSARANQENVESRDRIRFDFSNVRAIEVVSPSYALEDDPDSGGMRVPAEDICSSSDSNAFALAQNEANLRGVFLTVSLSNGTMFIVDIYDLNAPCRGGEGNIACTLAETGPDRFASIRRHRLRFGFTPNSLITVDGSPSFQFNTAPGGIDETTGDATGSDGPGLEFINCPPSQEVEDDEGTTQIVSSMTAVFGVPPTGSTSEALICASSQVWSNFSQGWDATWEGLIPDSEGGLGLFADVSLPIPSPNGERQPGNWFQAGDVPFCRVGVLGPQGADAAPVQSYAGDRLLITGELPPSTRDEPACEEFQDLKDDIDDLPVWFPVKRAFNDQLEIGPSPNPGRYTLDEVRNCFPQFTEYQIHTQDAYTVTGTTTGFINRVVPNADGECVLDPARPIDLPTPEEPFVDVDTYLTGRAFEDKLFINPIVSFEIRPFPPDTNVTDSTVAVLNFNILNQFSNLFLVNSAAVRSLPSSMLFSPERDELFFVDLEAGVSTIQFSPLNFVQTLD